MNRYIAAVRPYLKDMTASFMFWVCLGAPIVFTLFNRITMPVFNDWLSSHLGQSDVLVPFYESVDAFVICTISLMVGYTGVLVMLDERDSGIAVYLAVSPLGKTGYMLSRLVVPIGMALGLNGLIVGALSLSGLRLQQLITYTGIGLLIGMTVSLYVLTFAHNRIEGIALTKVGNVLILGIPFGAYFTGIHSVWFMWLPTFWVGRFSRDHTITSLFTAFVLSLFWLAIVLRRITHKPG